jgi:hypothetical protein
MTFHSGHPTTFGNSKKHRIFCVIPTIKETLMFCSYYFGFTFSDVNDLVKKYIIKKNS